MRWAAAAALAGGLVVMPRPALAHGVGGRADLPVPLEYFIYAAALVLVVSFAALALLWPRSRWQGGLGNPARTVVGWGPWGLLQVVGLVALVLVVAAGLFGSPGVARNFAPVSVYVVFWLVVPILGALVGDLWTLLNPWRTLSGVIGLAERPDQQALARWGVWPAVVIFVAWAWLELVYPDPSDPRALALAAIVYTFYAIGLAAILGKSQGLQVGEAFTTYNRLVSSIAPLGRDAAGRVVWRGWLRALPVIPRWPGLAAFVVAMIGTVTYDGLSNTLWWVEVRSRLFGSASSTIWFQTLALAATVGVIGAGYLAACWAAARIAGGASILGVARSFAHTLVPIALAYAVAHYFTLVLFEGQLLFSVISDPFGMGWDLFGTADYQVNYTWYPPLAVWYTQLGVIVGGHLLGVVLAHDRALAEFPGRMAVRSQYAMLGLMVVLTGLGLTILSAG